jgi:hypothetical protein
MRLDPMDHRAILASRKFNLTWIDVIPVAIQTWLVVGPVQIVFSG